MTFMKFCVKSTKVRHAEIQFFSFIVFRVLAALLTGLGRSAAKRTAET
jgi:hypothetical protein